MYYKNISSRAIVAKVYRDFGLTHSGWHLDAIEWIGEALGIIGHSAGYIKRSIQHDVKQYRARLLCTVESIEGVTYNGARLFPNDAITNTSYKSGVGNWYTLNPGYINTNFENGTIYIIANTIAVDEKGYPMVPDEEFHKEACKWFIFKNILAKGYKHPVFSYEDAERRWIQYYPQAQNAGNFPSFDEYDDFRRMWTATIPDQYYSRDFFEGNASGEGNDALTILPRDNERTIIHVDN